MGALPELSLLASAALGLAALLILLTLLPPGQRLRAAGAARGGPGSRERAGSSEGTDSSKERRVGPAKERSLGAE